MGVKNLIKRAGEKAGDKVAQLSKLSPEQLAKVDKEREAYLTEMDMHDPQNKVAVELTDKLLAANAVEIYNAYLPQLKELYIPVEETAEYDGDFASVHNIRYFRITKWVTDKKENSLEKIVNVYEVLSNEECNIALVFHRGVNGTDVYLAVTNTRNSTDNTDVNTYKTRIEDAIRGNFPGAEWTDNEGGIGVLPCLDNNISYSVATATNIPTEKSEKFISQTIEKLLDGVVPENRSKEYTIILLATPIQDIDDRKLRLEEIYSGLAPYAGWSTNFNYTESNATSSSATIGVNVGASAGVQNGTNQALTDSDGTTESTSRTDTDSTNQTVTNTEGDTNTISNGNTVTDGISHSDGTNQGSSDTLGGYFGGHAGLGLSAGINGGINYNHGWNRGTSTVDGTSQSVAKSVTESVAKNTSKSLSNSVGHAVANTLGKAVTKTASITHGVFKATNFGLNFGANFARSSSVTATIGKNEGITQNFTNYNVKHALELLEDQMKRYEESSALGMWDFAAYVLSEDANVANNVAHSYLALTEGEKSYMSKTAVNLWRGDTVADGVEVQSAKEICKYLRELRHPIFGLNPDVTSQDEAFNVYPSTVTATTALSGKELAYSLNFPQRSIAGLPVLECAEFGRNVTTYDDVEPDQAQLRLGHIFHMNHMEKTVVNLSKKSLASHTFITGSTGSGKSNTVYRIIDEALRNDVKFLVVEPAKGEYKDVFGNDSDVSVYGTNLDITPLLRINPFSFPNGIHILEHLDRLVEIFNVCWPMYAAMPAVLKNAIEKSYEDCGWNLTESTNSYGDDLYPDFSDVARNIRVIIDSSEYDAENKGAYKGSLLTRLQSLTNGINGLIFTDDEISDEQLFDENVIVDLSRVGSSETKSLIMGLMVLKLQEHRMTEHNKMNGDLRHLTVLEEAHNILKRTSTDQPVEGGNLKGKSVEMISNAIAEMRTYGEGFVIVDQAPGLLDMAAIRNTNTKIIMRLPDQSDRELVGRAANLNDNQITELAKIPCGVGAVYQNEWIQPVLCKVERYDASGDDYKYTKLRIENPIISSEEAFSVAELLSKGTKLDKEDVLKDIHPILDRTGMKDSAKVTVYKMLMNPPKEPRMTKLAPIMAALFPEALDAARNSYVEVSDPTEWTRAVQQVLRNETDCDIDRRVENDIIQSVITYCLLIEANNEKALREWCASRKGGNVI